MSEHTASCSCGQLTAEVSGNPVRISVCHCTACQRRTGSVFGQQARFEAADVKCKGESSVYKRQGDSGGTAEFHFCPQCGSTVYFYLDSLPDLIAIPVGAFADPTFPAPTISIYEERMHDWVEMPTEMEHIP